MSKILQDFSGPSVKNAIEANIFEHMLLFRYWNKVEVHDDPDILWSISKIPIPRFNNVLRARISPDCIDSVIDTAITRCKLNKVPLLWWTGPATHPADLEKYLMAHGLTHKEDKPGMAVDIFHLREDPPAPAGLIIEQVTELKTLEKWCKVNGVGFGLPDSAIDAFLDFNSELGFNSQMPLHNYIGWLKGEPVATSTLVLAAGVAGIYNVATVPEARRMGIGNAMTLNLLREARAKGYRVGVLYASKMGINVYLKMGFKEFCTIGQYLWEGDRSNHNLS
jgi:ribosomal protein S18 acetylase RimI-like enzyme